MKSKVFVQKEDGSWGEEWRDEGGGKQSFHSSACGVSGSRVNSDYNYDKSLKGIYSDIKKLREKERNA